MSGFASLLSAALKIASLDLCADEYLLMFAAPKDIASVSFLARDSQESPLAGQARGHPANDGSIESVLPHHPEILLTTRRIGGARAQIAERMGIDVITLPYADSPETVAANVRMVAGLVGGHDAARRWQQRFDRLRHTPATSRQTALFVSAGGLGTGPATQRWLDLAGISPVALKPGLSHVEQIAAVRPDIVLQSRYRADQYSRNTEWQDHPLTRRLQARRISVDGRAWTCAGPLMLGEIEKLRDR